MPSPRVGSCRVKGGAPTHAVSQTNRHPTPIDLSKVRQCLDHFGIHDGPLTLWQIAIAYEVKIDDIKRLNNLLDDSIYPGSRLLIKTDVVVTVMPTVLVTAVQASNPTAIAASDVPVATSASLETPVSGTFTPSAVAETMPVDNKSIMSVAIGIIVLALLGGGVFTWLGRSKKE